MKRSYEIKHIFTGSKDYKMPNGLSIHINIIIKEIKYDKRK